MQSFWWGKMAEIGVTGPSVGLWWPGRQINPYLADECWLPFSVPMGALSWHSQTKSVYCVPSLLSKWERAPCPLF